MTDARDTEIANLKKQVADLTADLEKERGIVAGRQPLALLRDQNGNINLGKHDGKAPKGYRLLVSWKIAEAIRKLEWDNKIQIPYARGVRYELQGSEWQTFSAGMIIPQEHAAEVAALAQELEAR